MLDKTYGNKTTELFWIIFIWNGERVSYWEITIKGRSDLRVYAHTSELSELFSRWLKVQLWTGLIK